MHVRSMVALSALAVLLVLSLPRPALGGGWAAVELSSTPDGLRAGQEWVVDLTIRQHGRTPLEGVKPAVEVSGPDGHRVSRFVARPTGRSGVYRARVAFPSAGRWEYLVDDGFGQVHSYPRVTIAEEVRLPAVANTSAGADGRFRERALGAAIGIGLAAAGLTVAARRRRPAHGSAASGTTPPSGRGT